MSTSEEIIIDGIKYNCANWSINKLTVIVSVSEAKSISEIYENRRKVPMYFRGAYSSVIILNILEQTYTSNDGKIIISLEIIKDWNN